MKASIVPASYPFFLIDVRLCRKNPVECKGGVRAGVFKDAGDLKLGSFVDFQRLAQRRGFPVVAKILSRELLRYHNAVDIVEGLHMVAGDERKSENFEELRRCMTPFLEGAFAIQPEQYFHLPA